MCNYARKYELLLARSEMLEKCRYCEPSEDQACCQAGCEIFDNVVEAIKEGLADINPCFYCPFSKTSCFGWDSPRPNPFPVKNERIDSFKEEPFQVEKKEGKVIMTSFSASRNLGADEVWLLSSQKLNIPGVKVIANDKNFPIKLALLFQKVKLGYTIALAPESKAIGAVLEKHGLIVEYSF